MRRQWCRDVGVYLLSNSTDNYILACIFTSHAVSLNENKHSVNFYLTRGMKLVHFLFLLKAQNKENKRTAYFRFKMLFCRKNGDFWPEQLVSGIVSPFEKGTAPRCFVRFFTQKPSPFPSPANSSLRISCCSRLKSSHPPPVINRKQA